MLQLEFLVRNPLVVFFFKLNHASSSESLFHLCFIHSIGGYSWNEHIRKRPKYIFFLILFYFYYNIARDCGKFQQETSFSIQFYWINVYKKKQRRICNGHLNVFDLKSYFCQIKSKKAQETYISIVEFEKGLSLWGKMFLNQKSLHWR